MYRGKHKRVVLLALILACALCFWLARYSSIAAEDAQRGACCVTCDSITVCGGSVAMYCGSCKAENEL
jgi:hypothetical protein